MRRKPRPAEYHLKSIAEKQRHVTAAARAQSPITTTRCPVCEVEVAVRDLDAHLADLTRCRP